jgi:hypothetical protein
MQQTTAADRARWMGDTPAHALAYLESGWLGRFQNATLYRYEMPSATVEDVEDVGTWVPEQRTAVRPLGLEIMTSLERALSAADVELRCLDELTPLRSIWDSSAVRDPFRQLWAKVGALNAVAFDAWRWQTDTTRGAVHFLYPPGSCSGPGVGSRALMISR